MKPNTTVTTTFACLVVCLWLLQAHVECAPHPVVRVMLVNDYVSDIKLHCASKEDDLGWNSIPLSGRYTITFRPNVFGTTRWTCTVQFQDTMVSKRFRAYYYLRDHDCGPERLCDLSIGKLDVCKRNGWCHKW
uniref:S-protein homolog n=1 Tax=Kalanchoe fedtschenkoi TaxID=63787 RepID=A0A7N1A4R1_KALFE